MKRFTETEKWRDPWFRKLEPRLKLLWQWLCDQCDAAGVIDPDLELAAFQIGVVVSEMDFHAFGDDRFTRLRNGKWHLQKFVMFQYGNLSPECRAHGPVFASLEKNRVSNGIPKVLDTPKDKDKDKDKDKATDKDKDRKEGVQREETDSTVLRLFALFSRRASTVLSEKEKTAIKTAGINEADLADVEAYYLAPHAEWEKGKDFRRRDVLTLLSNWAGEVTRAGAWKAEGKRKTGGKPEPAYFKGVQ